MREEESPWREKFEKKDGLTKKPENSTDISWCILQYCMEQKFVTVQES